jgi:hypothetical protein
MNALRDIVRSLRIILEAWAAVRERRRLAVQASLAEQRTREDRREQSQREWEAAGGATLDANYHTNGTK